MLVFAAVLMAAVAAGAWLDWHLWHPMSGITITIGAIFALVMALVLWLARRPFARGLAAVALAVGIGLIAGQVLGPSRPELSIVDGTMTIRIDVDPAAERTGRATCSTEAAGDQLQAGNDPNEGRPSESADFISVSISIGDRWDFMRQGARPDHLRVFISVGAAVATAARGLDEVVHASDAASELIAETRGNVGTMRFANLALVDGATGRFTAQRSTLRGTIEWTCPPSPAAAGTRSAARGAA
jgi:hypothetical protein